MSKRKTKSKSWYKKTNLTKRTFLNPIGQARATIDCSYYGTGVSANMILADCNRQVSLDFSFDLIGWRNSNVALKEYNQRIKKVDTLIAYLSEMKEFMETSTESFLTKDLESYKQQTKETKNEALGISYSLD